MKTLTDGKNQVTTWNYDEYGRATNKVDATSTEIFRYRFDPNGRLTNRWTAAKGNTLYRCDNELVRAKKSTRFSSRKPFGAGQVRLSKSAARLTTDA